MDLFDEALHFATEKHSGQRRKLSSVPYILHPMEVATVVGSMTEDREVLAAALLHDTIEDAGVTPDEIKEKFGMRVLLLVLTETEDKQADRPPEETWCQRKEETLLILENTKDIGVKMLWLGDKLANMRSFARQYRVSGDSLWSTFHQKDPAKQAWYYRLIVDYLRELEGYDAYREFTELVDYVFQNVPKD